MTGLTLERIRPLLGQRTSELLPGGDRAAPDAGLSL